MSRADDYWEQQREVIDSMNEANDCECPTARHEPECDECDEKPVSVFAVRFQVGCDFCGFIEERPNLLAALKLAACEAKQHTSETCKVTVYDRCARQTYPQVWDASGKVLSYRLDAQGSR